MYIVVVGHGCGNIGCDVMTFYLLHHGICNNHFIHKLTQFTPDSLRTEVKGFIPAEPDLYFTHVALITWALNEVFRKIRVSQIIVFKCVFFPYWLGNLA